MKDMFVGEYVIVRTDRAGVWAGQVVAKEGCEVILHGARRMWQWKAAQSISLSGCAKYGIDSSGSKIAPALNCAWMEAIEILPLTPEAQQSIMEAPDAAT